MPTVLITRETAREYARKANEAKRAKQAALLANPPAPASDPAKPDPYLSAKLGRVRKQIEAVDKLIESASDPQAVDRFAAALARLYEIERQLAGRPLPGSLRPTGKPTQQSRPGRLPVPSQPSMAQQVQQSSSAAVPTQAAVPPVPDERDSEDL